jgi:microbial collagenase
MRRLNLLLLLIMLVWATPGCRPSQESAPDDDDIASDDDIANIEASVAACSGPDQSPLECGGERPSALRPGDPALPANAIRFGNSVGHGDHRYDSRSFQPGPLEPPSGTLGPGDEDAVGCDSSDLMGLSGKELTSYLAMQTMNCLYYLWTPDAGVQAALVDANVQTVANKIVEIAAGYDGTNSAGYRQLWFFVRIAYYHAFYGDIPALDESTDTAVQTSLQAMAANGSITSDGAEAGAVLYELVHAADASDLAYTIQPLYQTVLNKMAVASRLDQYEQAIAVHAVLFSIARQATQPAFSADAAQMNALIGSLAWLASNGNMDLMPTYEWVVNNAIWALGQIAQVPAFHQAAVTALVAAQDAHPYLSVPFLWTVQVLDNYADCETSDPMVTLCMADVRPALEAMLFPNSFNFDDGALFVRSPLTLEDLQPLYHAGKEVLAQFNRISETMAPLAGDPNGELTMVIYGTKSDYEDYHGLLFGLPTNNGGIYIEQDATFYTYERLPSESIYTLEDLFRHEYVHYLVGRFLIDGFWGEVPIYDEDRMIWFDEGLAEFLVWSTPGGGVRPRRTLVNLVAGDGANRLTIAEIFDATYSSFTFYRYAGLFFLFLYENDIGTLRDLLAHVHVGDIAGFDALVASLAADAQLETSYQAFLDELVAQVKMLDDPSTSFPELASLDTADIAVVQAAFRETQMGYLANCSLAAIAVNPRFSCRGYLTTVLEPDPPDPDVAWAEFDADLDGIISDLVSEAEFDNFQHLTCRFARITPIDTGLGFYSIADYYCDGPLGAGPHTLLPHLAQVQQDFEDTRVGGPGTDCTEPLPGVIQCETATSTKVYPAQTPTAVLQAEFDNAVTELHNQVYATRPSYYRQFECASAGDEALVNANGGGIYMVGNIHCTAVFAP